MVDLYTIKFIPVDSLQLRLSNYLRIFALYEDIWRTEDDERIKFAGYLLSYPETDHYDCKCLIARSYFHIAILLCLNQILRFVHTTLNCYWINLHKKLQWKIKVQETFIHLSNSKVDEMGRSSTDTILNLLESLCLLHFFERFLPTKKLWFLISILLP